MTNNLTILRTRTEATEGEENVRDQVTNIINERREDIERATDKWLVFWAEFGRRQLFLDDFPVPLSDDDRQHVAGYLKDRGFQVLLPRWGRASVLLEPPEKK